ncbi:arsenite methyltransferase-like [Diadema antillarum]|uniref:arsenite methyltransferase-like n=1 Tax=Diadema antillarum TaxID=105358 RepID=UPI003A890CEE
MLEDRSQVPASVREALAMVHPEIENTYYGCGLVMPSLVRGATILDLGSGAGRDCYALSKLVGADGHVTGIDMTEELLDVAKKFITYHQEKFGYSKPNVEFRQGLIENLKEAGLNDNQFDIVISNCVLSLSPDKPFVLREAHRVLRQGGELYFSDIYVGQDIPMRIKVNKVLWGEGMAGALHWQELVRLAKEIGFTTPRLVTAQVDEVNDEELQEIVGDIIYVSATYRLFKSSEDASDSPAVATYDGSLPEYEESLPFDKEHTFVANVPQTVDGELASILKISRYSKAFRIEDIAESERDSQVIKSCPVDPYKYIKQD